MYWSTLLGFILALYIIPYLWITSESPFLLCIQVNSTCPVWVWWKEGMANRSTCSIKGISISMGTMQEIYLEICSLWSSHLFKIVQHVFTWTHKNRNLVKVRSTVLIFWGFKKYSHNLMKLKQCWIGPHSEGIVHKGANHFTGQFRRCRVRAQPEKEESCTKNKIFVFMCF